MSYLKSDFCEETTRCARDSDWCDGVICRTVGFNPDCPNADLPTGLSPEVKRLWHESSSLERLRELEAGDA